MSALLLSPHNDDAVLFASWLCLKHRPHVVTVLRSVVQEANGITHAEREKEDKAALNKLYGLTVEQWGYQDEDPPWELIAEDLSAPAFAGQWDSVFAPWPEPRGHVHHNEIGQMARDTFGDRVRFYATYQVGGPRTELAPHAPEPWMIPLKLRALACYESQMLRGPRRFFMHALDEWTMP